MDLLTRKETAPLTFKMKRLKVLSKPRYKRGKKLAKKKKGEQKKRERELRKKINLKTDSLELLKVEIMLGYVRSFIMDRKLYTFIQQTISKDV